MHISIRRPASTCYWACYGLRCIPRSRKSTGSFTHVTHSAAGTIDRPSDLLYFSMAALTLGYGDIFPVSGVVRMLSALEAGSGALYLAITVALLVSAHKQRNR